MTDPDTARERWIASLIWNIETDRDGLSFRLLGSRSKAEISTSWPVRGSREEICAALRQLVNDLEQWVPDDE